MDRTNALGHNTRADLPGSVELDPGAIAPSRFMLHPTTYLYAGLVGFCCCSAAVIVTAGLLARAIQ